MRAGEWRDKSSVFGGGERSPFPRASAVLFRAAAQCFLRRRRGKKEDKKKIDRKLYKEQVQGMKK